MRRMNQTIYERITQAAGGLTELARSLGEQPNAVANWKARGVPANRCKAVERLTGIHVSELRPQDWRDYWPEEAAPQRETA
jgi:DNA-binding transcriptional regulator YdaS (Cro superfamily)